MRNGFLKNDYKKAKQELIEEKTNHLFFSKTQEEAGFNTTITERTIQVIMPTFIREAIATLKKDKIAIINLIILQQIGDTCNRTIPSAGRINIV